MTTDIETPDIDVSEIVTVNDDGRVEVSDGYFGALVLPPDRTPAQIEEIRRLHQRRLALAPLSYPESTWAAYRGAWKRYCEWCESVGREPLDPTPDTVSLYLTHLHNLKRVDEDGVARTHYKKSSIKVALSGIRAAYQQAGVPLDTSHPSIAVIQKAIAQTRKREPVDDADPINLRLLKAMLNVCPTDTIVGIRARAVCLLGFLGCLRRSEIQHLMVSDVELHALIEDDLYGVRVRLRHSKTDQKGEGDVAVIPDAEGIDPVLDLRAALQAWLEARTAMAGEAPDDEDTLFCPLTKAGRPRPMALSGHAINGIIQELVEIVRERTFGNPAEQTRLGIAGKYDFSAHSLRAGMATEVSLGGGDMVELMRVGRWRSAQTAQHYVKDKQSARGVARVLGKAAAKRTAE